MNHAVTGGIIQTAASTIGSTNMPDLALRHWPEEWAGASYRP
jgi:hypothetical protein